jgi:hypothetical protein
VNQGPDMVAWEALREQQYSPREAARAADIVVQALRKKGLLKEPTACGCGPTEDEKSFAETGRRIKAMPLEEFNEMYQELWERGEGGV